MKYLAYDVSRATIEISWLGEMKPEDIKRHLLQEKTRHPTRQIGKCFPYLPINQLPAVVGDYGEGLDYYPNESLDIEEGGGETSSESIPRITRRLWM